MRGDGGHADEGNIATAQVIDAGITGLRFDQNEAIERPAIDQSLVNADGVFLRLAMCSTNCMPRSEKERDRPLIICTKRLSEGPPSLSSNTRPTIPERPDASLRAEIFGE